MCRPPAGTPSPITALGSYRLSRNTSVLVTGHESGELRLHTLLLPQAGAHSAAGPADDSPPQAALSPLQAFPATEVLCSTPHAAAACGKPGQPAGTCAAAAAGAAPACAPIVSIYSHGAAGTAAATAVIVDALGRLAVLKHGGPTGKGGEACAGAQVQC